MPYRGAEDLAEIQATISRDWIAHRPLVSCTVADLEWWQVNEPDIPLEMHLSRLVADGRTVGFRWADPPNGLDWYLSPGVARAPFLEPLLDELEASAARAAEAGLKEAGARSTALVTAARTEVMDADDEAVELLTRRGYTPDGSATSHWIRTLPAAGGALVPEPALPPGYRHAATGWPEDLDRRVEVHRSAFAPSRMSREKYERLATHRHYDPSLDRVIVAPDGSFAAFANAWFDPVALVGELEPVGAHVDHRRLGLARAVCYRAIAELERRGAREVLIFTGQSNAPAEALYESLGAVRATTTRRYTRPVGSMGGSRQTPPAAP